eukprot:3607204-Rhodomonas_salina.2
MHAIIVLPPELRSRDLGCQLKQCWSKSTCSQAASHARWVGSLTASDTGIGNRSDSEPASGSCFIPGSHGQPERLLGVPIGSESRRRAVHHVLHGAVTVGALHTREGLGSTQAGPAGQPEQPEKSVGLGGPGRGGSERGNEGASVVQPQGRHCRLGSQMCQGTPAGKGRVGIPTQPTRGATVA